ncbi:MAG: hypothetical protein IT462_16715 [Planctomycetes bacterium]|nr:hypothetical protein [Planctomycetota bacterium]
MKAMLAKRLALVVCASITGFLAACATQGGGAASSVSVKPTTDDYVSRFEAEDMKADKTSRETPRVEASKPEPAASGETQPVADRIGGAARVGKGDTVKVSDSEKRALANYYADEAYQFYRASDFDKALKYVDDALSLDDKNPRALQVKNDVDVALGSSSGEASKLARTRADEERATRSEARYEINSGLDRANKLINEGKYSEAIAELEKVLDVIRWTGYMLETEAFEREARLMIEDARQKREESRVRDYVKITEQERRLRELEMQEELDRYREEIRNLYTRAKEYFDRKEYRECIIVLDKILREDPYNDEVARMKTIARNLEKGLNERNAFESFNQNWKQSMATIVGIAAFPENDITLPEYETYLYSLMRSDRLAKEQRTQLSKEDISVRAAIENVEVQLPPEEMEIDILIERLRAAGGGINIIRAKAVSAELKFQLDVGRVKLRQALNFIQTELQLSWRIENGAVVIDAADAPGARNAVRRVFNVADLLVNLRNFRGSEPRLSEDDTDRQRIPTEPAVTDPPGVTIGDLADVITNTVHAGEWDDTNRIVPRQQDLIVVNRPEIVDAVENLLTDLRRSQGLTVTVEARFISIRDDFLEDIGMDFRGIGGSPQIPPPGVPPVPAALDDIQFGNNANPVGPGGSGNAAGFFFQDMPPSGNVRIDQRLRIENLFDQALGGVRGSQGLTNSGGASFQLAFVDNPEINAVLRAVRKRERATLLTAPRITVHNTQRAHVSVMNEIAYIRDFNTNVATGTAVADPVVDVIRDGIVLDVRPTVSADRRYITLELRPTLATVLRPIPTFTTSLGVGTPVAIQTPQLTLQRIRTTITLPDGGSFVIGGLRKMVELDEESGIPFLSDIPLLGALFKRKGKSTVRSDIMIIVTARIVDPEEEVAYHYDNGVSQPRNR